MARIVVVGAGMGAMGAAARLATAGHRVTVVERGTTHGGAVGRYERDGYAFDTGPGLLHLPAVWRDLFVKTGRRPLEACLELTRVDPMAEHRFADGTSVRLPGFSPGGVRQALDAALGDGAGARWAALLARGRRTWEATRRPLMEEPLTSRARAWASSGDPYPAARRRGLLRRRPPTLAALARDELGDPRLGALLAAAAGDYAVDPRTAPAAAAVLAYIEHSFGTWYPLGGMRALADAVRDRCAERGVAFEYGAEATGILRRAGRAAGVALADGSQREADTVVWGGAGPGGATPTGRSRLTLLLALRGARPDGTPHRTVLHPADPFGDPLRDPVVTVLRPGDPALLPDPESETAVLSAPVPAGPAAAPDLGDLARRLLEATDRAGLGLRERLRWQHVRTPADVERDTGVPGGVIGPPSLAGAGGSLLAPPGTGDLPGAYRAGGLVHPGGGLAHAGMSGTLAAGLIIEGPHWRGSY